MTAHKYFLIAFFCSACGQAPTTPAPVAARDSAVSVERVSGLSFVAPTGIVRLIPTPSSLTLHVGEAIPTVTVQVEGRSSTGQPIAVPVPYYIITPSPIAKLGGGYIHALRAGTTTLFVLYDPAFADAHGVPREDPGVAKVAITVIAR